ncbi:MAG: hypothetical protein WC007_19410, partial [Pelobacteraceae bacterium]
MTILIKLIIVSMAVISISGCYTVKSVKTGEIIQQNKTIEVPATGFSIMEIKAALINNGWNIKVANKNVSRVRMDSANPQINSSNNYDAAYRLIISESVRADSWV